MSRYRGYAESRVVAVALETDTVRLGGVMVLPTAAELNFVDGVTSAIQTQLDAKQPLDADLTAIAALAVTNGNFIVGNGTAWVAESGATARTSLSLGTMATQAASAVAITGGTIKGTPIGGTTAGDNASVITSGLTVNGGAIMGLSVTDTMAVLATSDFTGPIKIDGVTVLPTAAELNAVADVSARGVAAGGTLAVTAALHGGRTVQLSALAGSVCTLPAATGSNNVYVFTTTVLATSNSHIVKVANATDVFAGALLVVDNATTLSTTFAAAAASDTITLNRSTTGSVRVGERFVIQDVAAGVFSVHGTVIGTGAIATPFSATV